MSSLSIFFLLLFFFFFLFLLIPLSSLSLSISSFLISSFSYSFSLSFSQTTLSPLLPRLIRFLIPVIYGRSVFNLPPSTIPGRPVVISSSIGLSLEQTQSAFSARWWKPEETVSHCPFLSSTLCETLICAGSTLFGFTFTAPRFG